MRRLDQDTFIFNLLVNKFLNKNNKLSQLFINFQKLLFILFIKQFLLFIKICFDIFILWSQEFEFVYQFLIYFLLGFELFGVVFCLVEQFENSLSVLLHKFLDIIVYGKFEKI